MHKYLFIFFIFSFTVNSQSVYKTPSGAKYHLGTCRMVENVSEEIALKKAAELGLLPCKICKPQNYTALGLISKKIMLKEKIKPFSAKAQQKKARVVNT